MKVGGATPRVTPTFCYAETESMFRREERDYGADWVEAEIEKELDGLAHLTLQDLEDEEEENGCHGNVEVWPYLAS